MRALRALGIEPGAIHMNEGHAALAPLELAREELEDGAPLDEALERARSRTVFTTHTPVPAGNDTYPADQARSTLRGLADRLPGADLRGPGAHGPRRPGRAFGVTQLALRMSRSANGVSRRHGEVARAMWRPLWGERPAEEVPIGHVTNGVHVPTWIGAPIRALLDRHLGEGWQRPADDPADLGAGRRDPRRRAVGGPQPPARRARRLPARAQRRATGSPAATRPSTSPPPSAPSPRTC